MEVDEKGHADRNIAYEIKRQKAMEEKLNCKFIRINPDAENYDIFVEIGKIHSHISESNKKLTKKITEESTKKTFIDNISKRLLEPEFESNYSIKSKCLRFIVKKILLSI